MKNMQIDKQNLGQLLAHVNYAQFDLKAVGHYHLVKCGIMFTYEQNFDKSFCRQ